MNHRFRITAAVGFLLVCLFFTAAGADFAGDLLLREARNAANEFLGAELTVDGISGNPVQGFSTGKITLSTEQGPFLSADSLRLKISPKSLLSMKPAVSSFSIISADIDGDKLAERLSLLTPLSGDQAVSIQRAEISGSRIRFGQSRAAISLIGLSFSEKTVSADIDIQVNSVPIIGTAGIDLTGGGIAVRSLSLRAGSGEIEALGTILPSLSVAGLVSGLDLAEISSLWPPVPAGVLAGKLSMSFVGEGKWNSPVLSGDLSLEKGSVRGIPVDRARAWWRFAENRLTASQAEGSVFSSPVRGTLSLLFTPGQAPFLEASFSGESFGTGNAKRLFPAGSIEGVIDTFSGQVSGTADTLSGTAAIRARSLSLFGLAASNAELQAEFTPSAVKLKGKTGIVDGMADFSGTVENYATAPRLHLTAAIRSFSLQKAVSLVKDFTRTGLSGSVNADLVLKGSPLLPEISGKVWSTRLTAGKEILTSPSLSFSLKGGHAAISSAAAQWRGAGITASGSVTPGGKLDITVQANAIQPGKFSDLLPGIPAASFRGTLSAKAAVKGTTASPSISLVLSSPQLSLPGTLSLKNLSAAVTSPGGLKGLQRGDLSLSLSAASGEYNGVPLSAVAMKATKTGRTISVPSASARSGEGSFSASGKVALGAKSTDEPQLELNFTASKADLAAMSKAIGQHFLLRGTAGGTASLKGPASNPSFTVKASSPKISLSGITAADATLQLSGTAKAFKIDRFSAGFKGGTLSGTGTVKPGKTPDITLNISAKKIDIKALAGDFPAAGRLSISGRADGTFKGRITGTKRSGSGTITSPAVSISGLGATNITVPLTIEGDVLRGKDISLAFYGGNLKGSGTLNLKTMKYTSSVSFSGVDVNAAAHAFAGGLGGKVTGQARGSLRVSGTLGPQFSLSGKGTASVSSGAVSGFRNVDIAARLYGTSGIRYTGAVIPFRLETGRVVLEKGARAEAPQNDPMYRFLTAEGTVGPRRALNLSCAGNINMKLFNALRGGAAGGISGGSLEDALQGLLGGFKKGMAEEDFRNTTFTVRGTLDKPSIANLKTAPPPPKQQAPAQAPSPAPAPPPQTPKPKTPEEILKEKLLESIFK